MSDEAPVTNTELWVKSLKGLEKESISHETFTGNFSIFGLSRAVSKPYSVSLCKEERLVKPKISGLKAKAILPSPPGAWYVMSHQMTGTEQWWYTCRTLICRMLRFSSIMNCAGKLWGSDTGQFPLHSPFFSRLWTDLPKWTLWHS